MMNNYIINYTIGQLQNASEQGNKQLKGGTWWCRFDELI